MKLHAFVDQFGSWMRTIRVDRDTWRGEREFWRATADGSGTLTFHPPDVPIRIWAVSIQPAGVIWAEACRAAAAPRPASSMRSGRTAGDGPPARSEDRASAERGKCPRGPPQKMKRPGIAPGPSPHLEGLEVVGLEVLSRSGTTDGPKSKDG
jgi:hypothetical protein